MAESPGQLLVLDSAGLIVFLLSLPLFSLPLALIVACIDCSISCLTIIEKKEHGSMKKMGGLVV